MAKDVHVHPEHLADYRKTYKNVYPFSDGIFKMLMANEAKPERTVKFLNAMLGLTGDKAIKHTPWVSQRILEFSTKKRLSSTSTALRRPVNQC